MGHAARRACRPDCMRLADPPLHRPGRRFKFVAGKGYRADQGELRFDMFQAEFTHEGDRCTFEVLLDRGR